MRGAIDLGDLEQFVDEGADLGDEFRQSAGGERGAGRGGGADSLAGAGGAAAGPDVGL